MCQGAQAGIDVIPLDEPGVDAAVGSAAAEQIFHDHAHTTAIFASTFGIGMGVLRAARRIGVDIPRDMSLVALHDSDLADFLSPTLTTIALPVDEMAQQAVDLVIQLIDGASPGSAIVRTPPQLKLRGSTARPRGIKRLTKKRGSG